MANQSSSYQSWSVVKTVIADTTATQLIANTNRQHRKVRVSVTADAFIAPTKADLDAGNGYKVTATASPDEPVFPLNPGDTLWIAFAASGTVYLLISQ